LLNLLIPVGNQFFQLACVNYGFHAATADRNERRVRFILLDSIWPFPKTHPPPHSSSFISLLRFSRERFSSPPPAEEQRAREVAPNRGVADDQTPNPQRSA
jgi:hypothetical protein